MLILSLLIVLCAVIGLSYYENIEYFNTVIPAIGNTAQCAQNAPAGTKADTLFQVAKNNKLNKYTDEEAAKQWDPFGANNFKMIDDCKAYTLGTEMKRPGPSTKFGMTVKCATNPPGDMPIDTYFQYSMNQRLMPYLNKEMADRFGGYDTMGKPLDPFIINDCSGFSLGNPITSNVSTPSTAVRPIKNWAKQLQPLLTASNSSQSKQKLSAPAQPIRNNVNPQVSVSDTGYNAMQLQNQSSLLSNIKKIVQDELRTNRVKPENHPLALSGTSGSCSNSTQQGNEYTNGKEDMSKYIKKDSIPCWGCTLDY